MMLPLPSPKDSFNWLRQIWSLAADTQKNTTEIKELRQEVEDLQEGFEELADLVKDLVYAQQRDRENAQHEREKLELRLDSPWHERVSGCRHPVRVGQRRNYRHWTQLKKG